MAIKETKVIISTETSKYERGMRNVQMTSRKTSQSITTAWKGVLGIMGAVAGIAGVGAVAKSFLETGIAAEKMTRGLEAALGSVQAGAEAQKFLREESERLGLVFENQIKDFQKVAAAARGTILEGQATRDIYTAMAEASTALQMSSDDTSGALRALSQMISKGNVQAEELRGQLGERLPGAFQLASEAMGVTTQELNKMLEMGKVAAADLLPKLAKVLSGRFKGSIASASQTAQAQINRLNNAYFEMKKEFMETGALDAFADAVKAMIPLTKSLGEQLQLIVGYWADVLAGPTAADVTKEHIKIVRKEIELLEGELSNSTGWLDFWKGSGYSEQAEKKLKNLRLQLINLQTTLANFKKVAPTITPPTVTPPPGALPPDTSKIDQKAKAMITGYLQTLTEYKAGIQAITEEQWEEMYGMTDKEKTEYDKRLQIQADFNAQYAEMGQSRFDLEQAQLDRQVELWTQAGIKESQIAKLTSDKLAAINKAETQQRIDNIQNVAGSMSDGFKTISEMGGKHSKEAFAMYKAFKITETIISTYSGAMKAYESLVGIPYVGPALAAAAAAATVAFGMAQISMIKNAQPPSYDQGGISNAKGLYQTGNIKEAHIPIPSGGKIPVQINQQQQPVQIIMNNPTFQDVETQRQVFAQIAEIVAIRVAPGAIIENYHNDGEVRSMVRGGV